MALKTFVIKRTGQTIVTLFGISILVYLITAVLPGNSATAILGQAATPDKVAAIEQQLGLNRPLHVQYFEWLVGILSLDLGTSYVYREPVFDIIAPRILNSLQLAFIAMGFTIIIAIPLGVFLAVKENTLPDYIISSMSYIGISLPEFVTGPMLLLLFAGPVLDIFPTQGYVPITEGVIPWLSHLILPAMTLMILIFAYVMRQTRSEMVQTLDSAYIRSARLKGLSEYSVLFKHALRNALLPTITVVAFNFAWLVGSIVVVEEVFSYPGLGRLLISAIHDRDIPIIQIAILFSSFVFLIANLIADILYSYLDPKIEYGG